MSDTFRTACFDQSESHYYKGREKDSWYWLFFSIWEIE
jgi:hypothetical protein